MEEVNNYVNLDFEDGEFNYYDKDGNLICSLGEPIEEILETNEIRYKRISELETCLSQKHFEIEQLVNLLQKSHTLLEKIGKDLSTHPDTKINFIGFEASQLGVHISNSKTYKKFTK